VKRPLPSTPQRCRRWEEWPPCVRDSLLAADRRAETAAAPLISRCGSEPAGSGHRMKPLARYSVPDTWWLAESLVQAALQAGADRAAFQAIGLPSWPELMRGRYYACRTKTTVFRISMVSSALMIAMGLSHRRPRWSFRSRERGTPPHCVCAVKPMAPMGPFKRQQCKRQRAAASWSSMAGIGFQAAAGAWLSLATASEIALGALRCGRHLSGAHLNARRRPMGRIPPCGPGRPPAAVRR